jgi:hypothetical protein
MNQHQNELIKDVVDPDHEGVSGGLVVPHEVGVEGRSLEMKTRRVRIQRYCVVLSAPP